MNTYETNPVRDCNLKMAQIIEGLRVRLGAADARDLVAEFKTELLRDDLAQVDVMLVNSREHLGIELRFRSDRLGSETTREVLDAGLWAIALGDLPGDLPDNAADCSVAAVEGAIARAAL